MRPSLSQFATPASKARTVSDLRSDMQNRPTYVGDGVYASYEGGMIKLFTRHETAGHPDNVIWLEPETFDALVTFSKQFWTIRSLDK